MTTQAKIKQVTFDESRCFALASNPLLCRRSGSPRAVDLFSGAGGASVGLHRAGFDVVGVDIEPQKNYPFKFICADALDFDLSDFDFIWASPSCQAYSEATPPERRQLHKRLIGAVREKLKRTGKPYIIENVSGARFDLISPVKLCGSMFGLPIERHRYFEIGNCDVFFITPPCAHIENPVIPTGMTRKLRDGKRPQNTVAEKRAAMETEWMTEKELTQAVPPAYSEFLGRQIIAALK